MEIFTILLTQPLANGLILFYNVLGNMGLAIILFSIFIKLILSPLTKKSLVSMKKMQDLRPALSKLQAKHKGDRQKLMKAQADFYKEKGFNPSSGCLPQILQIVVLYAFYSVFHTVLTGADPVAALNTLLYEPLKLDPGTTFNTMFLGLDLTKPNVFNIPGIPFAIPGLILIMSALAQFVSAKMVQPTVAKEEKIAKKTSSETDDALVASQKYMIILLPIVTLLVGVNFAAGLALYWLVFSLMQTLQQYQVLGWGGLTPWIKLLRTRLAKS
jgi:YidC/Oxa1 family membrane protein insertase